MRHTFALMISMFGMLSGCANDSSRDLVTFQHSQNAAPDLEWAHLLQVIELQAGQLKLTPAKETTNGCREWSLEGHGSERLIVSACPEHDYQGQHLEIAVNVWSRPTRWPPIAALRLNSMRSRLVASLSDEFGARIRIDRDAVVE